MINRVKIIFFALLLFLLSSAVAVVASEADGNSVKITAIEADGLSRIAKLELIDLVGLRVGDAFDMRELKRGIKRAFKKSVFLDIQAVSEPYENGIKLKYIVSEIPLIDKIIVQGNSSIRTAKIKKAFMLVEGEDFREELLGKAIDGLLEFYDRKGFPEANISIRVERAKNPDMVNVNIDVQERQPLMIEKIIIPEDVSIYLKVYEGGRLDRDVLDSSIERIRKFYKEENYLNPVIGRYEMKNGILVIPVHPGLELKVAYKGNMEVNDKLLKRFLTFLEDEEVSKESTELNVEEVRKFYLREGYYYVQVAAGIEINEDIITVTFYIIEGEQVVLTRVGFRGTSVSTETIRDILPFEEGKEYNEDLLNSSKEALEQFYHALGYLNMEITDVVKTFKNDGKELKLEFVINEGIQTRIEETRITGNKDLKLDELKEEIRLEKGSPYNVVDIGDSRYRVLALYGRYGYLDVLVDVESRIEGDKAFLVFKITENKPSIIGKTIIRGNYRTKTRVIEREFSYYEGGPYNYEEILKIRQRLYKLGIFNEVSIEMLESDREIQGALVKDVLVSLKEGKAGSVEIGVGYSDYERMRGTFDISYRNIDGYSRQVGLRTEVSSVDKRIVFNFREPRFLNLPDIPLTIFVMKENKRSINIDTDEVNYIIDRLTLLINVEKELVKGLKANINYEFSFVDTQDVKPEVVLSKEDTGSLNIGSMSPSLFYDTRDNPFNPTSGALYGIVMKFASEMFLSETEFVKGIFLGSWFTKLNKKVVFALSLRGGASKSFLDNEELPLVERFFLGGRTTVRGYSHDSLGPKSSDGTPTGGNMFALGNAEFRISLGKGFGLVTFLDGGNVWQTAQDTAPEMKYTAGAGLRYNTPVGPVRLDYGYKLNRMDDESKGEVHFSFGHAF